MSWHNKSIVFALPKDLIPTTFETVEGQHGFVIAQSNRAYLKRKEIEQAQEPKNQPGNWLEIGRSVLLSSLVLRGLSRSGWFEKVLEDLIGQQGETALDFLTEKEDQAPFVWANEDEDFRYRYTALDSPRLSAVAADVRSLIAWCESNPDLAATLISDGFSRDDVLEAIHLEDIAYDMADYVDDGIGPDYLFCYLRGLLVILDRALAQGFAVVCFQEQSA